MTPPIRSRRLRVESLEPRQLLAVTTVDTHLDVVDPEDGLTSLREAITASNSDIDADEIRFAPWLSGRTIRLTQGDLNVTGELSIVGPGANLLTIDASGNDPTPGANNGDGSRVFTIGNGDPDLAPQVSIAGVTLTGGDVEGNGGAIWAEQFELAGFASGTLAFLDSELSATGSVDFSVAQRESNGTLSLLGGAIEVSTAPDGHAAGANGATGSGVDIILIDSNDDSDAIQSASYNVGTNTISMVADCNTNDGFSAIRIVDLADAIGGIQTAPGIHDFLVGTLTNGLNFLTAADAGTYADVLTGGLDASASEAIDITAVSGATGNIVLAFVEQAGVGATPFVSGNVIDGYRIHIDSGNTETTLSAIAAAVETIAEVETATTTSIRSFNGSIDNTPAALVNVTGARDAGTDVITVTAEFPGPALNRNLSFDTSNSRAGGIAVSDDGVNLTISIDGSSQYHLSDIADAITSHLTSFRAEYSGDGSGTFEADRPTDNAAPIVTNIFGGADPADGSGENVLPKPLVLEGVFINDSHALGSGGGVYSEGSVEVTDSTFAGNRATSDGLEPPRGGALFAGAYTEIENSTISDNQVVGSNGTGGGLFVDSLLNITQSTITFNIALGTNATGGGVAVSSETPSVEGTILNGNFATAGKPDVNAPSLNANYSIFGTLPGVTLSGSNNQLGVDPLLLPLGDYGGPTPTHYLLADSPAIDAGDPELVSGISVPLLDQRGAGFSRVASARIDVGAVEYPGVPGDFTGDREVNGTDFLAWQRNQPTANSLLDLALWTLSYGTDSSGELASAQTVTPASSESVSASELLSSPFAVKHPTATGTNEFVDEQTLEDAKQFLALAAIPELPPGRHFAEESDLTRPDFAEVKRSDYLTVELVDRIFASGL